MKATDALSREGRSAFGKVVGIATNRFWPFSARVRRAPISRIAPDVFELQRRFLPDEHALVPGNSSRGVDELCHDRLPSGERQVKSGLLTVQAIFDPLRSLRLRAILC